MDTSIVGPQGTPQLAALAIAATLLSTGLTLFNFLAYGTTVQVARLHGAGENAAARRLVLDGILIGASDTRFLKWSMVAAFACFAPLALHLGVVGVWVALNVLMAVRLITCGARFLSRRWAVTGAS